MVRRTLLTRCLPATKNGLEIIEIDLQAVVLTGERARIRTWDRLIKSQMLYQLSYAPERSLRGLQPSQAKPGRSISFAHPERPISAIDSAT